MSVNVSNVRPKPDKVIVDIADYVGKYEIKSAEAYNTARLCLMDTLGCGLEALEYPACTKLLGPLVPGTAVTMECRTPVNRLKRVDLPTFGRPTRTTWARRWRDTIDPILQR